MIEWLEVKAKNKVSQDVRVSYGSNSDSINIAIKRGAWITKLHRGDRISVGFSVNNGIPTAMYFVMSGDGYAVSRKDSSASTVGIKITASKLQDKYPRLKLSELQGDYALKEDPRENAYYISLGAKSY